MLAQGAVAAALFLLAGPSASDILRTASLAV